MPVILPEHVAAVVRMELAGQRMQQTTLREFMGMSKTAMSARFRGEIPWTVTELGDVARALGMRPGELVDKAVDLAAQVEQPRTPRKHPVSPPRPVARARKQRAAGPTSGPVRRGAA